jgi:hypothetical protein
VVRLLLLDISFFFNKSKKAIYAYIQDRRTMVTNSKFSRAIGVLAENDFLQSTSPRLNLTK